MELPCKICKHMTSREEGFRRFVGCDDEKLEADGFEYNDWNYHHTCKNQEIREECLECDYRKGIYCSCVRSSDTVDGKCTNRQVTNSSKGEMNNG